MNSRPEFLIREPQESDFAAWCDLYAQYCQFYETPFTQGIAQTVWDWIEDPASGFEGRVVITASAADFRRDGSVVGLAHFRAYPIPLLGTFGGYIDDIFVQPGWRGRGAGDLIMEHIESFGRARRWPMISWITAEDNRRARSIYDRHARRTDWVTYEIEM